MKTNEVSTEKTQKTSALLAVFNLILSPLYYLNAKLGLTTSIVLTGAALYELHEIGKSRRPGSNTLNNMNNFFAAQTGAPTSNIDNAVRNIVNGGDVVFDELAALVHK